MDKNRVQLCIIMKDGAISIPFLTLRGVDDYTRYYEDNIDIFNEINEILELDIPDRYFQDVCILYQHYSLKYGKTTTVYLPVKLKRDNYDSNDLKKKLREYLKEDYRRIKLFDIRYLKSETMQNYLHTGKGMTDIGIDYAVESYFATNSYKKKRDTYFALKDLGQEVAVREDDGKDILDKSFKSMTDFTTDDIYLNGLIEFSKKGEEEYSRAMELMASQDLEELDKKVHHPYYGMVDGLRDKQSTLEKELILVHSTGLSIEELKNLANRDYNRRSKGSR